MLFFLEEDHTLHDYADDAICAEFIDLQVINYV